jgi:hypothetical protein
MLDETAYTVDQTIIAACDETNEYASGFQTTLKEQQLVVQPSLR